MRAISHNSLAAAIIAPRVSILWRAQDCVAREDVKRNPEVIKPPMDRAEFQPFNGPNLRARSRTTAAIEKKRELMISTHFERFVPSYLLGCGCRKGMLWSDEDSIIVTQGDIENNNIKQIRQAPLM